MVAVSTVTIRCDPHLGALIVAHSGSQAPARSISKSRRVEGLGYMGIPPMFGKSEASPRGTQCNNTH